jgi:glycosyltransferase involved in cell wall biosynthesis
MTEFTILMPCLNEAETLPVCIKKATRFLHENNIAGEVLIADNGSTDNSVEIAKREGARVVSATEKGYGSTLLEGINGARGKYVIMGDADDSYDFSVLTPFIEKLRDGHDFVMGNRYKGGIKKGAMPMLHKYLGNPALTALSNLFFHTPIGDVNCGLRGFNREKMMAIGLVTPGMEFAIEMVIKATVRNLKIAEVPIILHPDGRNRAPHLNTWRDGWRGLVFLLMNSPKWLFFIPSLAFFFISLAVMVSLLPGTLYFSTVGFDLHSLTIAGSMMVLSYQLFLFALFIRIYSLNQGFYPAKKKHLLFTNWFSLERGILLGLILLTAGMVFLILLFSQWKILGFGPIPDISATFRFLIPALTLISLGVQTIFSSFFIRILGINPVKKAKS